MKIEDLILRIKRKWMKMRLQPIRVFCFHQTSEQYDPAVYCKPDWMPLSELKGKVQSLQNDGYTFISLQEAYKHIRKDKVRKKKYAVLTCDDGLKCQAALIPWLEEEKIPMTMFVSAKYLEGKSCGQQILNYFKIADDEQERKLAEQLYLNSEELSAIDSMMVTIGMHGYEHVDDASVSCEAFHENVENSIKALRNHKHFISFYAYPYGKHTEQTDNILKDSHIMPVYVDGLKNYNDILSIHREIL